MSNLIFCLMGPTASGKTNVACELIQHFPFEIISVDSAMIYQEMNIGTAKPDNQTLAKAPHHLIDILTPPEQYSAALFCQDVVSISEQIIHRGNIPLLVGGTMMYFRALQQGLSVLPEANESLRAQLIEKANQLGWEYLHQELNRVDARSAARIHPHDTQRIQRALEVYYLTEKPLSEFLLENKGSSPYRFINVALMPKERIWLHERIAKRFSQMLEEGFIEEVDSILKKWHLTLDCPSMRTVGYRQVVDYLQGEDNYDTLYAKGVAATRQLAKRQLTWLRHWPEKTIITAENHTCVEEVMVIVKQILDNLP